MWSIPNFKSFLRKEFKGYLEFRRSYGFKAVLDRDTLKVFDKYLMEKNIFSLEKLTPTFFNAMIVEDLETKVPRTIQHRLGVLNNFFQYLKRHEMIDDNPIEGLACKRKLFYAPAVFTVEEIKTILKNLAKQITHKEKNRHFFLAQLSRYCAIYIQAACGMRISEVCNLELKDYDSEEQTLFIRNTKFRKDRCIPISEWTDAVITNYLETRRRLLNDNHPPLLLTYWKDKWDRKTLDHYFRTTLKALNMYKKPYRKGNTIFGSPSTHSLRHSLAVNTIKRWKKEKQHIDGLADALAAYLGHADFRYTHVYLKALEYRPQILVFDPDDIEEPPKRAQF